MAVLMYLVTSMIGIGYLTLPIHILNNGIVLGEFIIQVTGLCSLYGSFLLVRVFTHIKESNYPLIVEKVLGKRHSYILTINLLTYVTFSSTIFLLFSKIKSGVVDSIIIGLPINYDQSTYS